MIRVLFVHSERGFLDLGKILLEREGGMRVDTTRTGASALELAVRERYDAVVSDLPVPGSDGIAFLSRIRSGPEPVPVIFTGRGIGNEVYRALEQGAEFYLRRGMDPESWYGGLRAKIREAVRVKNKKTELREGTGRADPADRIHSLPENLTRYHMANSLTVLRGRLRQMKKLCRDQDLVLSLEKTDAAGKEIFEWLEIGRIWQEIGTDQPAWQSLASALGPAEERAACLGIRFSSRAGDLEIWCDPLVSRVFLFLVNNAARHTDRILSIRTSCLRKGQELIIVWEDNGCGVPAPEKEAIFTPEHAQDRKGLTFSLCRKILATTGLTIRETGVPGRGSRFEIVVPSGEFRAGGPVSSSSAEREERDPKAPFPG